MTEQRASDQAEIQQMRQRIAELQQAVTVYQSQLFNMQPMLPPRPSMPFSPAPTFSPAPGFTPGIPPGFTLGSMQMPNPLAQQGMSVPVPLGHAYNAASGPQPEGPTRARLASAQFGATDPAQVAAATSRLSAIEELVKARASLGGVNAKACPMQAPLQPKEKSQMLKEVADAAKAYIPQFKLVKNVSELMAACREVLLKVKARWPRVILTEAFQQASLEEVVNRFNQAYMQLPEQSYSEPEFFKRHQGDNMDLDDTIIYTIVQSGLAPLNDSLKHKLEERTDPDLTAIGQYGVDDFSAYQGFLGLSLACNFLCKSSWSDGVVALRDLMELPSLFAFRYHSSLQQFEIDFRRQLKAFTRQYGQITQDMILDFALMQVIRESDARHIVESRKWLENQGIITSAVNSAEAYRQQVHTILQHM